MWIINSLVWILSTLADVDKGGVKTLPLSLLHFFLPFFPFVKWLPFLQICKKRQTARMPFAEIFDCVQIFQQKHNKTNWIYIYFLRCNYLCENYLLWGNLAVKITTKQGIFHVISSKLISLWKLLVF